jgi:hypothetical protein
MSRPLGPLFFSLASSGGEGWGEEAIRSHPSWFMVPMHASKERRPSMNRG